MRAVAIAAVIALFPFAAVTQEIIEGTPIVLDGDTLLFKDVGPRGGDRTVRIWGIDAPEMSHIPWGAWSRAALDGIIGAGSVSCRVLDADQYGRDVATCIHRAGTGDDALNRALFDAYLGDARWNLALLMLAQGQAVTYRTFLARDSSALRQYLAVEADAQRRKRGIWKDRP